MKKLLTIASLLFVMSPLAQAGERGFASSALPEARNDGIPSLQVQHRRYVKRIRCRDGSYHVTCRRHGGPARRWR
jgi:hypothetical protein